MNKEEVRDLFSDRLTELDDFSKEIQRIKDLINLIIDNFDLIKEGVTDEQVGEISSDINVKVAKINALIKDILSDSKKLEAFINEIKLLKRKRDKKLKKDKKSNDDGNLNELLKRLMEEEKQKINKQKTNPYIPDIPYQPNKPNKWDITC